MDHETGDSGTLDRESIGSIEIWSSTIMSSSPVGYAIGSPSVRFLRFSGICFIVCDAEHGINASSIMFSDASSTFIRNDTPLFGTTPSHQSEVDMVIAYRAVTFDGGEHLSSAEGPYLHVGHLSIPESEDSSSLDFCVRKGFCSGGKPFERCFDDTNGWILSVIVRSSHKGRYSFPVRIDRHEGNFVTSDRTTDLELDLDPSFIDVLFFESGGMTCYFHASGIATDRSADLISRDILTGAMVLVQLKWSKQHGPFHQVGSGR
jgi:hypothetical protein